MVARLFFCLVVPNARHVCRRRPPPNDAPPPTRTCRQPVLEGGAHAVVCGRPVQIVTKSARLGWGVLCACVVCVCVSSMWRWGARVRGQHARVARARGGARLKLGVVWGALRARAGRQHRRARSVQIAFGIHVEVTPPRSPALYVTPGSARPASRAKTDLWAILAVESPAAARRARAPRARRERRPGVCVRGGPLPLC